MSLEALKRVVARTEARDGTRGTAFLISRTHALTCAHCLAPGGAVGQKLRLYFSSWPAPGRERQGEVLAADDKLDVAVLELLSKEGDRAQEAAAVPVPLAGRAVNGARWVGWGYPGPADDDGLEFDGTVKDAKATAYGKPAIQLDCPLCKDAIGGASGSPVLVYGHIVGIATTQLNSYDASGRVQPVYDVVYARPLGLITLPAFMQQVRARWLLRLAGPALFLALLLRALQGLRLARGGLPGSRRLLSLVALASSLWCASLVVSVPPPQSPQVSYCRAVLRKGGAVVGVGPLTFEDVARRAQSFRVTTLAGRVVALEAVNGHGSPTGEHSYESYLQPTFADEMWSETRKPCRWVYTYTSHALASETAYDAVGRFNYRLEYRPTATPGETVGDYKGSDGRALPRSVAGASRVLITEDARGYVTRVRYFDQKDRPRPSDGHDYGRAYDRDDEGRINAWSRLDDSGVPLTYEDDCVTNRRDYDERGRVKRKAWYDARSRVNPKHVGVAIEVYEYDRYDNLAALSYQDNKGQPARGKDGYARATYGYNDAGDRVKTQYWDEKGRPTAGPGGYAEVVNEFEEGRLSAANYRDTAGNPATAVAGFVRVRYAYSPAGQLRERAYFLGDGKPAVTHDGYAAEQIDYDEHGRLVKRTYRDPGGRPIRHAALEYAAVTYSYDRPGFEGERVNLYATRVDYFGLDDQPTLSAEGIASLLRQYDDNDRLVAESYLGLKGEPTRVLLGYARVEFDLKYEPQRGAAAAPGARPVFRRETKSFFGLDNDPIPRKADHFVTYTEYDVHGAKIRRIQDGLMGAGGVARVESDYDEFDQLKEERTYNAAGARTPNGNGFAVRRLAYYRPRLLSEVAYFDASDPPRAVQTTDGVSSIRYLYDDTGHLREESFHDRNGALTLWRARYPYALRLQQWDDAGRLRSRKYLDDHQNLTAGTEEYKARSYNYPDPERGIVEETTYGEEGAVAGVVSVTRTFSGGGDLLGEAYFDGAGKRFAVPGGYAGWAADFDERQNWSALKFFGPDGRPCAATVSIPPAAFFRYGGPFAPPFRAELRGKVETQPLDIAGLDDVLGRRRVSALADAVVVQEYAAALLGYEIDGENSARWKARPTEVVAALRQFWPLWGGGGFAEVRLEWDTDAVGRTAMAARFYDAGGQPGPCRDGYRSIRREFGTGLVGLRDVLEGFAPAAPPRLVREYAAWGGVVAEQFQGADGAPVDGPQGFASARWGYVADRVLKAFTVSYADAAGKGVPTRLVVAEVSAPGNALRPGDVIVAYGGRPVANAADLAFAVCGADLAQAQALGGAALRAQLDVRRLAPQLWPPVEVRVGRGWFPRTLKATRGLPDIHFEDRRCPGP